MRISTKEAVAPSLFPSFFLHSATHSLHHVTQGVLSTSSFGPDGTCDCLDGYVGEQCDRCGPDHFSAGDSCFAKKHHGEVCTSGAECFTGNCVGSEQDGVSVCCAVDTCSGHGTCASLALASSGAAPGTCQCDCQVGVGLSCWAGDSKCSSCKAPNFFGPQCLYCEREASCSGHGSCSAASAPAVEPVCNCDAPFRSNANCSKLVHGERCSAHEDCFSNDCPTLDESAATSALVAAYVPAFEEYVRRLKQSEGSDGTIAPRCCKGGKQSCGEHGICSKDGSCECWWVSGLR